MAADTGLLLFFVCLFVFLARIVLNIVEEHDPFSAYFTKANNHFMPQNLGKHMHSVGEAMLLKGSLPVSAVAQWTDVSCSSTYCWIVMSVCKKLL